MRGGKNFSEIRNKQVNRVSRPQQTSSASIGGPSSRNRVATSSTHIPRLEEGLEAHSLENGSSNGGAVQRSGFPRQLSRFEVQDILSDSSGHSSDNIHLNFDEVERVVGSLTESCIDEETVFNTTLYESSPAIPIPNAPGQLTQAFRGIQSPNQRIMARSAPVPVPGQALRGPPHLQRTSIQEPDQFIPPHEFAGLYDSQDPIKKQRFGGCRGLSSLLARNAVLAQLGYLDGHTSASPAQVPVFTAAERA